MSYYPLSQIKQNLYTNGGEYILSSTKEDYKGNYYTVSNGKKYTGKNPQDKPNILLIVLFPEPSKSTPNLVKNEENEIITLGDKFFTEGDIATDVENYNKLFLTSPRRIVPYFNPTLPTQKDLNLGQFNRYFCKKTNELKYLEIDKETYDQLKAKDPKIAWDLYEPASILWIINGDQEDTFNANKFSVFKIEQNQRWYGFSQYFREDYLKYYESGYGGGAL